ncbi:MAG: hypothetical protein NTV81_00340 [Candidatus Komeilibacteria bacterium]|nr:hypothetical protein [Candidatus Komeilibacteria bacterium]
MDNLAYLQTYIKLTNLAISCSTVAIIACFGGMFATIYHKDGWKLFCIIAALILVCLTGYIYHYRDSLPTRPVDFRLTAEIRLSPHIKTRQTDAQSRGGFSITKI